MDELLAARDTGLTAPFWAAAAAGQLVRPVCHECGRSHFSPQWACPHCHSENWDYQPSTGLGQVYSSTVVHRGPDTTWATPYVLAIIDLDDGWSMLSRLVDVGDDLRTQSFSGRRVRVRFEPEGREPNRTLPVFVLTG